MTFEKALDRIRWRFTSGSQFKPNKNDIEAFNALVEYYEKCKNQTFTDNRIFGSLYIWAYRQFLQHYNVSVFDNRPQIELHKVLDKSPEQHAIEFTEFLNDQEIYSAFDVTGCPDMMHVHVDHLRGVLEAHGISEAKIAEKIAAVEKDREDWRGRFQEYLKEHPAIESALYKGQKPWKFNDVRDQLNSLIVKAIQTFGNK